MHNEHDAYLSLIPIEQPSWTKPAPVRVRVKKSVFEQFLSLFGF